MNTKAMRLPRHSFYLAFQSFSLQTSINTANIHLILSFISFNTGNLTNALTGSIPIWVAQVNGYESEQAPGDDEGQGSLVCCSPWGRKESDTTEQLNNVI